MIAELDLFDTPVLPGLSMRDAIVDATDERALIDRISTPRHCRRSASTDGWENVSPPPYGWRYDFDTGSFAADRSHPRLAVAAPRAPRPSPSSPRRSRSGLVDPLRSRRRDRLARDRPIFEHVIGVSLGSEAAMRFRRRVERRFDRISVPLAPRSIYHLSGEVRHGWEHSIAAMDVPRWSVTFRSLSDKGRTLGRTR